MGANDKITSLIICSSLLRFALDFRVPEMAALVQRNRVR